MAETCRTLIHEWFERVWNQGQVDAIDELMAGDAVVHGLKDAAGSEMKGADAFKAMHSVFRRAFPNLRIEIDDCIADGERIAFRCTARGTHSGQGLGVEPTGKSVEFQGMGFVRVMDGKFVEAWNTFDFQTMYAQLGIQPK